MLASDDLNQIRDKFKEWLKPIELTNDQRLTKALQETHAMLKERERELEQRILKEMNGPIKEVASLEQTVKRLERQIEILQKEISALKKDALTEVDIRPFKKLLK